MLTLLTGSLDGGRDRVLDLGSCSLNESFAVCTCQLELLPIPTVWTIASLPPPAVSIDLVELDVRSRLAARNWKTEPPLKSTL